MKKIFKRNKSTVVPHDIVAETKLLAMIMADNACISYVSYLLRPNDFYNKQCRAVFCAMCNLYKQNMAINKSNILHYLKQAGQTKYMKDLDEMLQENHNVYAIKHYVNIVCEKSQLRQIAVNAMEITTKCNVENARIEDIMHDIKKLINLAVLTSGDIDVTADLCPAVVNEETLRGHVLQALQDSMAQNNELYQRLAQ